MIGDYNWVTKYGHFDVSVQEIIYKDTIIIDDKTKKENHALGLIICNKGLIEGTIEASVMFKDDDLTDNTCLIVPYFDNETSEMLTIGFSINKIPGPAFFLSRYTGPEQGAFSWKTLKLDGNASTLKPNILYKLKTIIRGSRIELILDDVGIFTYNIAGFNFSEKQSGLFCTSKKEIIIKDFKIIPEQPKVFAIMQFTSPYNELYSDVIVPICNEKNIETKRADEMYTTGLIINDIINEIWLSNFIIAEITPMNPNVFFEIGYALALNKPIILVADKGNEREIPFDVRGFRILYYDNTIAGKNAIMDSLRSHIDSILKIKN